MVQVAGVIYLDCQPVNCGMSDRSLKNAQETYPCEPGTGIVVGL